MTFSPKDTFAKSASAQPWTDVASSALFREAAGVALLQMQSNIGMAVSRETAEANCYKLEGARQFLAILMNLTTPPEEPRKRSTNDNLIHT